MLSTLYAAAARRRRERYAARPDLRRRLRQPVISVGNIAVGGRGKTPVVAGVARLLLEIGERPAILSRGYRRTAPADGVVVVRDPGGIRADLARAGDEPFMLARQLPGAIVLTSPDRYLAGRLAELRLGATVHVLDDGFQHHVLDRDLDLVLVQARDLEGRTLPSGRLREPPDVLVAADAILSPDPLARLNLPAPVFRMHRLHGEPVYDREVRPSRVLAAAGIAEPEPFLQAVRGMGLTIAGSRTYRDHHPFSAADVDRLVRDARAAGAEAILTTEKDFVRLLPHRPWAMPVGYLPLTMDVEPLDAFRQLLATAMAAARDIVLA